MLLIEFSFILFMHSFQWFDLSSLLIPYFEFDKCYNSRKFCDYDGVKTHTTSMKFTLPRQEIVFAFGLAISTLSSAQKKFYSLPAIRATKGFILGVCQFV